MSAIPVLCSGLGTNIKSMADYVKIIFRPIDQFRTHRPIDQFRTHRPIDQFRTHRPIDQFRTHRPCYPTSGLGMTYIFITYMTYVVYAVTSCKELI
jgi:hypothetical protein